MIMPSRTPYHNQQPIITNKDFEHYSIGSIYIHILCFTANEDCNPRASLVHRIYYATRWPMKWSRSAKFFDFSAPAILKACSACWKSLVQLAFGKWHRDRLSGLWNFEFGHLRDSVGLGSILHRIIQLPLGEFTSSHVRQESFWQCLPLVNMASSRTWHHSFHPNLMAWLQPHSCIIWSSRGLSHFKHCFGFAVVQHGLEYHCHCPDCLG